MARASRYVEAELAFARWGEWVVAHRVVVLIVTLAITLVLASGLPMIRGEFDDDTYLRAGDDALVIYDAFRERYGTDDRTIVGVTTPEIFDIAFLEKLRDFHEALEAEVPYLEEVTSLVNARSTRGEGDELIVEDLMEGWAGDAASLERFRRLALANPLYLDVYLSREHRFTALNLKFDTYSSRGDLDLDALDFSEDDRQVHAPYITDVETSRSIEVLEAIADRFDAPDFRIDLVGSEVLGNHLQRVSARNSATFIAVAIAMMCALLVALFRRFTAALLTLCLVIASMIATFGLMGHLDLPFTVMTQLLPIFLLAVGVCDSVHILSLVYRRMAQGESREQAIPYALGHSGLAIVLTSLTTAGGLVSFVAAKISPIAELGIIAPIGVLIALCYSLTLLPALLAVVRLKPASQKRGAAMTVRLERGLTGVADFATGHPKAILVGTLVVILIATVGIRELRFSNHILHWLFEDDPVRVAMEHFDTELRGLSTLEILIDTGRENGLHDPETLGRIESAMAYAESFQEQPIPIGKTISIVDIVKEIHQALNENRPEAFKLPEDRLLIAQELLLFENSGSDDLEELTDSQFREARITVRAPTADAVEYVRLLEVLEPGIADILGPELPFRMTGGLALSSRAFSLLLESMARSYALALLTITPLMIFLIGNFRLGLLAMIPNLIPVYLILGLMGWVGIPLNMSTMLIGSVVIGLAVDDTIHFVHKFNVYLEETGDPIRAVHETFVTTGVALLSTSIILSLSFFTFMLSDFYGLVHFGILAGSAALIAFLSDILVAPALMVLAVKGRTG